MDVSTGMVIAATPTGSDEGDFSQVAPLLEQIDVEIGSVTADGAYDGTPTCDTIAARAGNIPVIIPPPVTAVLREKAGAFPSQRNRHIALLADKGRLGWQKDAGYGKRALVETAMGRFKAIIGPRLGARNLLGQRAEAAVSVAGHQSHALRRTPEFCPLCAERFLI